MKIQRLIIGVFLLLSPLLNAQQINLQNSQHISQLVNEHIKEKHEFFGLASYYNQVHYYLVDQTDIYRIAADTEPVILEDGQWFAAVGRFNILVFQASGAEIYVDSETAQLTIKNLPQGLKSMIVGKPELAAIAQELDQLRYHHLWGPFATLAKLSESTLLWIQKHVVSSWVLVIVVFAILIKLLLLPLAILTVKFQRRVSEVQTILSPQLAQIKQQYDGEEAHNALMAAHKKLGVSPFYTLKPLLATLIQIPVLIAIFNALGEMPQLAGVGVLWIDDLVYPDVVMQLSASIPLIGNKVSLLPVLMMAVTFLATVLFQNSKVSAVELKKQKRNLYLMGLAFLILFYPFPAVMVFYWQLSNTLQIFQQRMIKV
ncbi:MAG: YidC/Oxa1 family membrane protein insertase [Proteobacteria bacterium]|nr:YidC/Oxa1 family membrane protein insertase [Pseudomonadota bacterium]